MARKVEKIKSVLVASGISHFYLTIKGAVQLVHRKLLAPQTERRASVTWPLKTIWRWIQEAFRYVSNSFDTYTVYSWVRLCEAAEKIIVLHSVLINRAFTGMGREKTPSGPGWSQQSPRCSQDWARRQAGFTSSPAMIQTLSMAEVGQTRSVTHTLVPRPTSLANVCNDFVCSSQMLNLHVSAVSDPDIHPPIPRSHAKITRLQSSYSISQADTTNDKRSQQSTR